MTGLGARSRAFLVRLAKVFGKRGLLVAAVFVAALLATVLGAGAATHSSAPAEVSLASGGAASLQASIARGAKAPSKLRARKAVRGHLPKAVKLSHPREFHLTKAHGKVFDVRTLKSKVVRRERPERTPPGFAAPGSRAAE